MTIIDITNRLDLMRETTVYNYIDIANSLHYSTVVDLYRMYLLIILPRVLKTSILSRDSKRICM